MSPQEHLNIEEKVVDMLRTVYDPEILEDENNKNTDILLPPWS